MLNKVINFIWFQSIWALAIFTQYDFIWAIGILFILFFVATPHRQRDAVLMIAIMLLGTAIDSVLSILHVFEFSAAVYMVPIPVWLIALWGAFALTLPYSLNYLQGKWLICACLGAVFGPVSYWAGERFSAVVFPQDLIQTLVILAFVWAVAFPLCMGMANYVSKRFN